MLHFELCVPDNAIGHANVFVNQFWMWTSFFKYFQKPPEILLTQFLLQRHQWYVMWVHTDFLSLFQAAKHFIEVVNKLRKHRCSGPLSWSCAIKFLAARKYDVQRAVSLYEQHELTRHREGLVYFDTNTEPLKSELHTGKFTILVSSNYTLFLFIAR